jgi:hypothetical protein
VGTHKQSPTHAPLGRLAKEPLRRLKIEAHALFNPLWRAAMKHRGWSQLKARTTAYAWLASEMKIPSGKCHIGYFDEDQTKLVIEICRRRMIAK